MNTKTVEPIETISSYARRTPEGVRVVLQLPEAGAPADGRPQLRLASKQGKVAASATVTEAERGVRVEALFTGRPLRRGVWSLAIRFDEDQPFTRVKARLLTKAGQPIALLAGPAPRTLMAPPRRQPQPSRKQRVVHGAARVADRALSVLPADRSQRYRAALRSAARRTIG